jgi:hypothetical protein
MYSGHKSVEALYDCLCVTAQKEIIMLLGGC